MKHFFKKLVVRLYWKLDCHTVDSYANQFTFWCLPSKMRKDELTVFVAELNRNIDKHEPGQQTFQFLNLEAARTFPDKVKIDVKDPKP